MSEASANSVDGERLAQLLAYCRANGRVCPAPDKWSDLWELLPGRQRVGSGWEPPPPLILAAWWDCSANEKQDRLELHMRYAADRGALEQVAQFLSRLGADDWVYGDGT
jgi:hypothetical protein